MSRCTVVVFVVVLILVAVPLGAGERSAKAVKLLTTQGPDGALAGWKSFSEDPKAGTGDVWTLSGEGVLVCKGNPKGYLYTEKSHTDFVLTLQWRTPPGKKPGSGGVLIRMTGKHKIWPKSLEAQLNVGGEGDFWGLDGYELAGSAERLKTIPQSPFGKLTNLKRTKGPVKAPGEWNEYRVIARGDTVTLQINGQEVNRATGCDVVAGPILLTSEGDEIHFRNIRLAPTGK
jgi:hypothetical protein